VILEIVHISRLGNITFYNKQFDNDVAIFYDNNTN